VPRHHPCLRCHLFARPLLPCQGQCHRSLSHRPAFAAVAHTGGTTVAASAGTSRPHRVSPDAAEAALAAASTRPAVASRHALLTMRAGESVVALSAPSPGAADVAFALAR
jgi:hypothetical protein